MANKREARESSCRVNGRVAWAQVKVRQDPLDHLSMRLVGYPIPISNRRPQPRRGGPVRPALIDAPRDGLQMLRVHTRTNHAQMVNLIGVRELPDESAARQAMRGLVSEAVVGPVGRPKDPAAEPIECHFGPEFRRQAWVPKLGYPHGHGYNTAVIHLSTK
jgi:hypothetical protein